MNTAKLDALIKTLPKPRYKIGDNVRVNVQEEYEAVVIGCFVNKQGNLDYCLNDGDGPCDGYTERDILYKIV